MDINKMGVRIKEESTFTPSALVSLRIALKSYFSTYKDFSRWSNIINKMEDLKYQNHFCTYEDYQEKYFQTIFHFHHFLELLMKDILRSVHPLLAVKVQVSSDDSGRILDLIEGKIPHGDTIEFGVSVKRLKSLPGGDHKKIRAVFDRHSKGILLLNDLRNRSWHRGTYYFRYFEFESLIAKTVLPIVLDCLEVANYPVNAQWKYREPKYGVDPIQRIIEVYQRDEVDYKEVAFFKCLGLAGYNVPSFRPRGLWGRKPQTEGEMRAVGRLEHGNGYDIRDCFVCEHHALVLTREDEMDMDSHYSWILDAECEECGLYLHNELGNPRDYGINVDDLWEYYESHNETANDPL